MPRRRTQYVCAECGATAPKWFGRCPDCGAWNSLAEMASAVASGIARAEAHSSAPPVLLRDVSVKADARLHTGLQEFDRVLGGGIVPGALVLLGGDPGIGKSTLLLQLAAQVGAQVPVLYVSGEESARQLRLRSDRIGADVSRLYVFTETNLEVVLQEVQRLQPQVLIIDSIQTTFLDSIPSGPGSVNQLRECTVRLMEVAKSAEVSTFLIGHVTKEGSVAGPRALEHIVDAVLYLEGERYHAYRLLRAAKNRFGSTDEVGVFEMGAAGLREVSNPSAAFLAQRVASASGSAVAVPLEGSRALLVEVQALVAATAFGLPRRTAVGVDLNRLLLLIAVLTKRLGLNLGNQDIYVNAVGGLKLAEPACDLGLAAAIAGSYRDQIVPGDLAFVGEVGLQGELRPVGQIERRLAEARRMGFQRCIVPAADARRLGQRDDQELIGAAGVREAFDVAFAA